MLRVLAVCGNGLGTSLVIKTKVQRFLDNNKIAAVTDSCSLAESDDKVRNSDIVLCSSHLAKQLTVGEGTHLVGLKNLMDEKEFGSKIMEIVKSSYPDLIYE